MSRSAPPSPRAWGPPPTLVEVTTLQPVPVDDTSEYVATLKSLGSTTIKPEVEGQVTRVLVTSGQRVAIGAPLLRIDARRQAATVTSQQADIRRGPGGVAPLRVGDRVTPDTLLTTIDTNDALEIHIPVPLERGPQLRRGLPVSVTDASGKEVAQTAMSLA